MSKIQPLFTWRSAIQSPAGPVSPVTRHVLLSISLYMSEKGEGAFPSMERLADDTALSIRTIKKHVPLAEQLGWIKVVKKAGRGKGWKRNDYKAQIPQSYYQKIKEIEEKAVQEIHHEGGAGDSPPKNKAVQEVHDGGAPKRNKVVQQVHPNTPYNSSINTPERRARENISKMLKNLPPPPALESLNEIEGFTDAYLDYRIYLKDKYGAWPNEIEVKRDYQKLTELMEDGNPPVKVIFQTIDAKAKSFFPIRKFNNKNYGSGNKTKGDAAIEFLTRDSG